MRKSKTLVWDNMSTLSAAFYWLHWPYNEAALQSRLRYGRQSAEETTVAKPCQNVRSRMSEAIGAVARREVDGPVCKNDTSSLCARSKRHFHNQRDISDTWDITEMELFAAPCNESFPARQLQLGGWLVLEYKPRHIICTAHSNATVKNAPYFSTSQCRCDAVL